MFLRAHRANGLLFNLLEDYIEMDIKEIVLTTKWNECNLINI